MSLRFSLGSSAEDAREPLLPNASGAAAPRTGSQRLLSLFSSVSRPDSPVPVPVDRRGFETFPVTFAVGIPLNVLAPPAAEAAIVREVLDAKTTDPSIICDILRRNGFYNYFFPGKHEKEIKRLVCQVLDEINFYREGCSQVQIANMKDELQQKETSVAQEKSMSMKDQAIKFAANTFESKSAKVLRQAEEAATEKSNAIRDDRIGILRQRIRYCENLRVQLMADSLVSKFDANDVRECAFVRWCRSHNPPLPNGREIDEFCGTATVLNDNMAQSGIVQVDQSRDIKFEVLIAGDGTDSNTTSVRFTGLCPVSPGSRQHVMFAQAFSDKPDVARRIEDHVKNALFNNFKDDNPETANVPTNATISLFGAKECDPVGHVVVTEEADLNPSCCFPASACSLLGGAKKIKRARQSKKKKARRSKSKSKRVRCKNKSRRI